MNGDAAGVEVEVLVEAEVRPTEDPERVRKAVENVFPTVQCEVRPRGRGAVLTAGARGTEGLAKLRELLRRERIRDAARKVFVAGLAGGSVTFYLDKQVAYVGRLSFSEPTAESPLGPIKVQICCDDPRRLIEWLTSKG